ncbi:NTP transferase domain-containing protein [Cognatishimia sp.]|uniref:nucleotidyltransferase family protein n=1 Tax=Cognatishimia sp. TaxID=2211648 RepID=UPI003511CF9C
MLAILILAAGRSSRMRGRDKLLEPVQGKALLELVARRALSTGIEVFVALPPQGNARRDVLPKDVTPIEVRNAHLGMGTSIATSVQHMPETISALMILPADMPELTEDDLATMRTAQNENPDAILRAMSGDRPGHPVVFPKRCFNALNGLSGDEGARHVIRGDERAVIHVALPAQHALTDLDTPEDWAAWRAKQKKDKLDGL